MRKLNLFASLSFVSCLLLSGQVLAKHDKGVFEGEYVPVDGSAESMEVSRPELGELPNQLGSFKIKFKRLGWSDLSKNDKKRIAKEFEVEGVFRGDFNPDFTAKHKFVNEKRSGVLYTQNDFLIPSQGDLFCASGVPLGGTEQLNFVSGTGDYAGLISGTIYLNAVINNCYGESDFLQNDFTVVEDMGSMVFAPQ